MENQPDEKQPNEKRPFYLSRRKAALYLEVTFGARCSISTLDKLAVSGKGPPFRHLGRFAVYEIDDLNAWAQSRLSEKVHSTSGFPPRDLFRKRPGRPRKPFGEARRLEDLA